MDRHYARFGLPLLQAPTAAGWGANAARDCRLDDTETVNLLTLSGKAEEYDGRVSDWDPGAGSGPGQGQKEGSGLMVRGRMIPFLSGPDGPKARGGDPERTL